MSIWNRITSTATSVGGSLGGVLARLAGVSPEERDPENSLAFTIGRVALGAKMARVDGGVSRREIEAFKEVFQVPPHEVENVAWVFDLAKQDIAGYEAYARQVARLFEGRPEVLEDVLDGLFHIAKADGAVGEPELEYLRSVAEIFGLSERFRCIRARHIGSAADDPYVVLGVEPCLSDAEVRAHYRKLVRDHHPARHIAAGMPAELVRIATDRLAAVNAAWDLIAQERSL
jgi:DnaJ like chaperone protein